MAKETSNPIKEVGVFLSRVIAHWIGFLGSSMVIIALSWVVNLGVGIPPSTWIIAALCGLVWACFLAWREEYRKVQEFKLAAKEGPMFTVSIVGIVLTSNWSSKSDTSRLQITARIKNYGGASHAHDWSLRIALSSKEIHVPTNFTGQSPVKGSFDFLRLDELLNRDVDKNHEVAGLVYFLVDGISSHALNAALTNPSTVFSLSFKDKNQREWTGDVKPSDLAKQQYIDQSKEK